MKIKLWYCDAPCDDWHCTFRCPTCDKLVDFYVEPIAGQIVRCRLCGALERWAGEKVENLEDL